MNICFFKNDPGPITKTLSTSNLSDVELNKGQGEQYIEAKGRVSDHFIKNGSLVSYPEKPDYECFFDYVNETWISDTDKNWNVLRSQRDQLLLQTDWTQVADSPVDKQAWAAYRQALRDLPSNTSDPLNVVWPTKPNA